MNGRCVFGAQYKQEDKEIMLYEEKVIETIPVGPLGLSVIFSFYHNGVE